MSEQEREYYVAGGDDLEKARAFVAEREAAHKAMDAMAAKYGGTAVTNGRFLCGIAMDAPPPGWKKAGDVKGQLFYLPKKTTKALKAQYQEIIGVRVKGAVEFSSLFKLAGVMKDGRTYNGPIRILHMSWEWVGDTLLLSVPIGSGFVPNGSRLLKMSEYWAMKEQTPVSVDA